MNLRRTLFLPFLIFVTANLLAAQTAAPKPSATPAIVETAKQTAVSRERREQAYQKLLEGQKYLWLLSRPASQRTNAAGNLRLAKTAFQKAVELDPMLAEGYTALAESSSTNDEALMFAGIAVKIAPDNFGAHQIAARVYTIKSRLDQPVPLPEFSEKAVGEWLEITRLDPRNAEAWAFLSEFYTRQKKNDEAISALKKWQAASSSESGFYSKITGNRLAPETAALKLAALLFEKGNLREAIEVTSILIADAPDNPQAIELLRLAVEAADGDSLKIVDQSLQQAIYANPASESLIVLAAQVKARTGKLEDAAKFLNDASARLLENDKVTAANLQVTLGDLYEDKNQTDNAVKAYQTALSLRGTGENQPVTDEDRDFTITVLDKIIESYKKAKRPADALKIINQSRLILGGADLFADSQLISFYRENGKTTEALAAIRALRAKNPDDYGMLRLEAQILTDGGKVDQAVALIRPLLKKNQVLLNGGEKPDQSVPVNYDDYTNYLFISNLYTQADRGKESVEAANQALTIAGGEERRQIAQLTLASAQQLAGDYAAAEETLRAVLKKTPDNPTALNNLGYFLLERDQKIAEALDLIQQAVKIEPANPSFLDSLGWAYYKQGNLSEAENYLSKAAKLDRSSSTIQEHLGDVYIKQGKTDSAKTAWQNALTLTSDEKDVSRLKAKIK